MATFTLLKAIPQHVQNAIVSVEGHDEATTVELLHEVAYRRNGYWRIVDNEEPLAV